MGAVAGFRDGYVFPFLSILDLGTIAYFFFLGVDLQNDL